MSVKKISGAEYYHINQDKFIINNIRYTNLDKMIKEKVMVLLGYDVSKKKLMI